jgi:hypothetical protein
MSVRVISRGAILLTVGIVLGTGQSIPSSAAEWKPDGIAKWEYRLVTKEQLLDLGKKDLAAGLNQLGEEGWELVAVDGQYIFKRPKYQDRKQRQEILRQIAVAEADVAAWKDRVAWAERMFKKGYLTERHLQTEKAQLTKAETALEQARKALRGLPSGSKEGKEPSSEP